MYSNYLLYFDKIYFEENKQTSITIYHLEISNCVINIVLIFGLLRNISLSV